MGDDADVISRRLRYLIISRTAASHHGSAPWIMQRRSSGNRIAHLVEVDRVLRLGRDGRAGDAGVEAQREVELAALGVERVETASLGGYMPSPQKLGPTTA